MSTLRSTAGGSRTSGDSPLPRQTRLGSWCARPDARSVPIPNRRYQRGFRSHVDPPTIRQLGVSPVGSIAAEVTVYLSA